MGSIKDSIKQVGKGQLKSIRYIGEENYREENRIVKAKNVAGITVAHFQINDIFIRKVIISKQELKNTLRLAYIVGFLLSGKEGILAADALRLLYGYDLGNLDPGIGGVLDKMS
jgi:hypothetical protein